MTGPATRPRPGCPARHGTSTFSVTSADFSFDVRDFPAGDGTDGTITEITGFFQPPGPAGTDPDAEPDLVAVAGFEVPAGSPASRLTWQAFTSHAGPARLGQLMRTAILACPCTFPAADCAALDECTLLRAIEQAADLGDAADLARPGMTQPFRKDTRPMTELLFPLADPPAISPLATTGAHAHPLNGECPVDCLDGLLSGQALNRVLTGSSPDRMATVGDLASSHRARTLGEVPGIGAGRIAEIEDLLLAAGLITRSECYVAAAASDQARRRRNWLAVIDGPGNPLPAPVARLLAGARGAPERTERLRIHPGRERAGVLLPAPHAQQARRRPRRAARGTGTPGPPGAASRRTVPGARIPAAGLWRGGMTCTT
jgi:hypothetical protein